MLTHCRIEPISFAKFGLRNSGRIAHAQVVFISNHELEHQGKKWILSSPNLCFLKVHVVGLFGIWLHSRKDSTIFLQGLAYDVPNFPSPSSRVLACNDLG
jgi:hypothetical protein